MARGGRRPPWSPDDGTFGAALGERRRQVAAALAAAGGGDERLLGVRGPALDRAREVNRALVGAPALPAWQRFTGVVWQHLDLASLPAPVRRRVASRVVVVSALCGLSTAADRVPDFRLKLSARLDPLGPLARWWSDDLTAALDAHLRRRLVIDLLPQEHAAAWRPAASLDVRRVRFETPGGRVAGHTAKAAKGLLARAVLLADDPERALAEWRHPDLRAVVAG
jgi:cytoplasmic iron level regulating protein YaaA (DUF328/UPF0246 family)